MNLLEGIKISLVILFCLYQIWAYGGKKTLKVKMLPVIILPILGLLFMVLAPLLGFGIGMGIFFIFAILIIEFSLIGCMLLLILEIVFTFISPTKNVSKILKLVSLLIILIVIYNLGQRVF